MLCIIRISVSSVIIFFKNKNNLGNYNTVHVHVFVSPFNFWNNS
jgi:hypothetical protein